MFHKFSAIHKSAKIGKKCVIGPFCLIGENVRLGDGCKLHSHVNLQGDVEIGENTEIFPFATLGLKPQHSKYKGEPSRLIIGRNNIIREHVTMHTGTNLDAMETKVGNNGLFHYLGL